MFRISWHDVLGKNRFRDLLKLKDDTMLYVRDNIDFGFNLAKTKIKGDKVLEEKNELQNILEQVYGSLISEAEENE